MWKWECSQQPKGVIVIIHGAGEHHGRYGWLRKQWQQAGFHIVMGDLPGQGKTRGKRGHIDSFNQYIETVYEWYKEAALCGLPVYLIGHSMGGLISIRTLMEKRMEIHGVILSSPLLKLAEEPPKYKTMASKALHRLLPSVTAPSGLKTHLVTRNEEIREAYLIDELRVTKVSLRWYQEILKAMTLAKRNVSDFPNVPLLLLQAGDDRIVNSEAAKFWFDQLQTSEKWFKEWDGLFHELFNEPERDDVFRYAKTFVELHLT
ncbi:phospholipase [Alkalihalophilus pseudofirmus]|nr:phospholipase [Alkalihalophilus pseudofirmus]